MTAFRTRRWVILFVVILALLLPGLSFAWESIGNYTHETLAKDALDVLPFSEYPDLHKFREELKDGSESEAAHEGMEKNGGCVADWWSGKRAETGGGVLVNYWRFDFKAAFLNVGRVCHLTQDQAVPAHAANISHGPYGVPPRADDLEEYADWHYVSSPSNGYLRDSFPHQYYQPLQTETRQACLDIKGLPSRWRKPSTGERYWIPGPDIPLPPGQDATFGGWGRYGGDENKDVYGFSRTESPEIAATQIRAATAASAGVFAAASRKLPPLVTNLAISGTPSKCPLMKVSRVNEISFKILENRKPETKYVMTVDSPEGPPIISSTAISVTLHEGVQLPWEGAVSKLWDGKLANGQYPADGDHTLYVVVEDEDHNKSPEVSYPFTIDATPPKITMRPAGGKFREPVTVTFVVSDPHLNLESVVATVNGDAGCFSRLVGHNVVCGSTVLASNGTYLIKITARDRAGNEAVLDGSMTEESPGGGTTGTGGASGSGAPYELQDIINHDPTYIQYPRGGSMPRVDETPCQFSPVASPEAKDTLNIEYETARPSLVTILIYDSEGKLVTTLVANGLAGAGQNAATWDGRNDSGELVPDGVYRYIIQGVDSQNPLAAWSTSGEIVIDNTLPVAAIGLVKADTPQYGLYTVLGTASDTHLESYTLECIGEDVQVQVDSGQAAVKEDTLGSFDTTYLDEGLYTLRLTVTDHAGNSAVDEIPLAIDRHTNGLKIHVDSVLQEFHSGGEGEGAAHDNPDVWVDDGLPPGSTEMDTWEWDTSVAYSGTRSHSDPAGPGAHGHYFIHADKTLGLDLHDSENIIQYVYLDPAEPPSEILLQFYTDDGDGEHRVYWGGNHIPVGAGGTPGRLHRMGDLPPAGKWIRLKIPGYLAGLGGKQVKGMAFVVYNGKAYWDKTTKSSIYEETQEAFWAPATRVSRPGVETAINYFTSQDAHITLSIYDEDNRLIKTVTDEFVAAGWHESVWDGTDATGNRALEGLYYFQFGSPDAPVESNAYAVAPGDWSSEAVVRKTVVTDSQGYRYEIDPDSHAVHKYDPAGDLVATITEEATGTESLTLVALDLDINDNLLIVDGDLGRVFKLNPYGYYLNELPYPAEVLWGDKALQFNQPASLSVDGAGDILVANEAGNETLKLAAGRGIIDIAKIRAEIRVPYKDSLVYATVPITGTASGRDFAGYTVDYGAGDSPSAWTTVVTSNTEVVDGHEPMPTGATLHGNLASWDTTKRPMGTYTIRLRVYDRDGFCKEDRKTVEVARPLFRGRGRLPSDDGLTVLDIPSDAIPDDADLFLIKPADAAQAPAVNDPDLFLIGQIYELKPAGYQFLKPCTLRMYYTDEQLGSFDERTLKIYRWNPISQRWIYVYADLDTANNVLTATMTEWNDYEVHYAVMSDPPPAPLIYQPASPSNLKTITVYGKASPSVSVEVFVDGISQGKTKADENSGCFAKTGVALHVGDNVITALAVDPVGNASELSSPVHVEVDLGQPTGASLLAFKNADFSEDLPEGKAASIGDVLYMELVGADADIGSINSALVTLRSEADPVGISVQLLETASDSGVYCGTARVGAASDAASGVIGVAVTRVDRITAVSDVDPSVEDSIVTADKLPPPAPSISSPTHPSLCQNTFESGIGEWSNMSGPYGATVTRSGDAASSGNYSVKLVNTNEGGSFANYARFSPFDAKEYPFVGFDYKVPEGVKLNLVALVNGMWKEIVFTDDPKTVETFDEDLYRTIGRIEGVTADDGWHHARFNLYDMLRNDDPAQAQYFVEELFFADYNLPGWMELVMGGENQEGATWYVDNFIIGQGGQSNANPVFVWSPGDLSVVGYSYVLDQTPDTVPDETSEGPFDSATFSNVPDGEWYFHVRSVDGGGNWGPADHYEIMIDSVGPVADSPEPADGSLSGKLEVKLRITDSGGSGVNPDTIQLKLNDTVYDMNSGGLSYDDGTGILTFSLWKVSPAPEPWKDGETVQASLIVADDFAGNPIQEVFSWSWTVNYSTLTGGYLSLLTTQGGYTPTWSSDGKRIAFMSDRSGNEEIWVMDADDYAEARGTARQVTFDEARDGHPTWSPVDDRIAFVSDRSGYEKIWMVNADGTGLAQLTTGEADDSHPTWSPDGTRIAFSRDGEIWSMDSDGSNATQLTFDSVEYCLEPAWSPDGTKIAYTKSLYTDAVAVMDVDGANQQVLTETGYDIQPAWSRQTDQIVFVSWRDEKADSLWVMNTNGGSETPYIENEGRWWDAEPEQSPVGDNIAFQSTRNGMWNIWVKTQLQVTNVSASPNPFSPNYDGLGDGVEIAFTLLGGTANVDLKIFDEAGSPVATLLDHEFAWAGANTVTWEGFDDSGNMVADGNYTYRIVVEGSGGAEGIEKSGTIVVDTTPPAFADWSVPEIDDGTTGPQGVAVTVTDVSALNSGATRLQYGIAGEADLEWPDIVGWTDFGEGAGGQLDLSWSNYSGKYLYLRCYAEDGQGNRSYSQVQQRLIRPRNSAPVCMLTAPTGGIVWSGVRNITWQASDAGGDALTVRLEYSPDGGASWVVLAAAEENDGGYAWDTRSVSDGSDYLVRVTVNDGELTAGDQTKTVFTVFNNLPPVAQAGCDQNTLTGQPVTLDASDSYDPEGAVIVFLWSFTRVPAGSAVTDAALSDASSAKPAFIPDVDGEYVVELAVSDGVLTDADEVSIRATTPNVRPNAEAGRDQNVFTGAVVHLDGSGSADPDHGPEPLWYSWSFDSVPAGSALGTGDITHRDRFDASFIPDVEGLYRLRLTVGDGDMQSADTVDITAALSVPPNAHAGDDFAVCLGNAAILDGSGSNDPDNLPAPLSYAWRFVGLPAESALGNEGIVDAATVSASFTPDAPGTYVLELMVGDGQGYAYDNVAVTVVESDTPPVADAGGTYRGIVGVPVTFDGSASHDPDAGQGVPGDHIVRWQWDLDGDGRYNDACGEVVTRTWTTPYQGTVGLKVTDDAGLSGESVVRQVFVSDVWPENYVTVRSKRITRDVWEYEYRLDMRNLGNRGVKNVECTMDRYPPQVTIVAGHVDFGDIAAGGVVTSRNTFIFRQDRRYPVGPEDMTWQLEYDDPAGGTHVVLRGFPF